MNKRKVDLIVGTRPNFIKCAVLHKKMNNDFNVRLVHTGQHYDKKMSDIFFDELEIPKEDVNLNVGSSSHAEQTAKIMIEYEKLLLRTYLPDITLVFGDVNSTAATVLTAAKLHIKTGHIEAGLRSGDMSMPEEINRLIVDSVCDYLFPPSEDAIINLKREGHNRNIFLVGNIMLDALYDNMHKIEKSDVLTELCLERKKYIYITLHRPSNVDDKKRLKRIISFILKLTKYYKFVFVMHPRTKRRMMEFNLFHDFSKYIKIIDPISYIGSIKLIKDSYSVITDSGGIQEETTYLNVPCYTMRKNTERPITVKKGTNMLIEPSDKFIDLILKGGKCKSDFIKFWDGKTSDRIIDILSKII